uniref:Uncharacterized protein n=1 Tax=Anguilla anguilla TaxID=7936 RepID=A0A0E9UF07_ANGAN
MKMVGHTGHHWTPEQWKHVLWSDDSCQWHPHLYVKYAHCVP